MRHLIFLLISLFFLFTLKVNAQTNKKYLEVVKAYADVMLKYGRDDVRYGQNTSPLFSVALRRDTKTPVMFPYPRFYQYDEGKNWREQGVAGDRWKYFSGTNFKNIPRVGDKVHKQTISGEDILENYGLYKTMYLLTELLNDEKYKIAADSALSWWFANTQGPSGLFPWGEHLGWDFYYDYVTYHVPNHENFYKSPYSQNVPVTELYQSFQHEPGTIENVAEFLFPHLAKLSKIEGDCYSPLEKMAIGIWQEHVWDKKIGWYNRHGDYFGRGWGINGEYGANQDEPRYETDGLDFPRQSGIWFDWWSYTYLLSENKAVKDSIVKYTNIMLDYWNIHRKDKNGIIGWGSYGQQWQTFFGAEIARQRFMESQPELSLKIEDFLNTQISLLLNHYGQNWIPDDDLIRMLKLYKYSERKELEPFLKRGLDKLLEQGITNANTTGTFFYRTYALIEGFELFDDNRYLRKADEYGQLAIKVLFDDYSPLPKTSRAEILFSGDGSKYFNYYHAHARCADLMWVLARLGRYYSITE